MKALTGSAFLGGAVVVVVSAVVAGLFLLGSPADERARRIDRRRVAELQGIAAATDLYWTRHARLPSSLDELTAEPGVRVNQRDPVRGDSYRYAALDGQRYELCADFDRESGELSLDPAKDLWAHGTGEQCFRLEAEDLNEGERSRE